MSATPLVRQTNADGYVVRFLDPRLAEALEFLPEYGEFTIVLHAGRVTELAEVKKTIKLAPRKEKPVVR